jgi:uncharacterized protein
MPDNYFLHYGFSLMAKPIGPVCNLNCSYCYYLEKKEYYKDSSNFRMSDEILEKYIKEYIAAVQAPVVTFSWQGGEPLLTGIDFFKKVIGLQQKYARGKKIENAIQTNGTLLDDEWCQFFKDHGFLIGISVDGTENMHDAYRKFQTDRPSFSIVMNGLNLLVKYNIPFNTLTVVHALNSEYPVQIYEFLKSIGSNYIQFIPVVERISENFQNDIQLLSPAYKGNYKLADWSVEPMQYGNFLISVFDQWVRRDIGKVFIQQFDAALANWAGVYPGVCVFNDRCGDALIIEHNGDVYSCDHFVFPEYLLGNLLKKPLMGLVNNDQQNKFGLKKTHSLPKFCMDCEYRFACHGECPKYRFCSTPDGEYGLNYLCSGYKNFFKHIHPYMQLMVDEISNKRPPSGIMNYIK